MTNSCKHLAADELRVFDLAVELAVGERPRAAFAELHVGLGVEHILAPQAPGVLGALAHFGAALQNDRFEAHLRQQQTGENPARAEAHHQRALAQIGRGVAHQLVTDVRRRADVFVVAQALKHGGFVAHLEVDGVDELQFGGFLARIVAALEQGEIEKLVAADGQTLQKCGAQFVVRVVQRQFEFSDS